MILIKETYTIVTEESASQGDFAETGWNDRSGQSFETVEDAVRHLRENGAFERSSSSFHSGIWYSSDPVQDIHDGSYETRSFHVSASVLDQESIYNQLFKK